MPGYQAIRRRVDLAKLFKTPELAAKVTLEPVEILEVDAAIVFTDILVVPEALGMDLYFKEERGPVFEEPLRSGKALRSVSVPSDFEERLDYVMETIGSVRESLDDATPIIGFAGAPWTLAAYMVEGGSSPTFRRARSAIYEEPSALHSLLENLSEAVVRCLKGQIAAGAQAVQLFDSWAGLLSPRQLAEFALLYVRRIVEGLGGEGVPIILFAKGAGHSLEAQAATGVEVVSLDWTVDIGEARKRVGYGSDAAKSGPNPEASAVALQGNLDPSCLFASPQRIREEVRNGLVAFGNGSGHIFNLGHGVLPETPLEHVKELVRAVKEESPKFHREDVVVGRGD